MMGGSPWISAAPVHKAWWKRSIDSRVFDISKCLTSCYIAPVVLCVAVRMPQKPNRAPRRPTYANITSQGPTESLHSPTEAHRPPTEAHRPPTVAYRGPCRHLWACVVICRPLWAPVGICRPLLAPVCFCKPMWGSGASQAAEAKHR
jgi:hypothetical protein